ncbi:hypothetical protein EPN81_03190 [Patescibacteria group bacterium]|nr:MAG: hypothetical protein EPN81_03190 [Patescibacteria group bacterium]
MRKFFAFTIFLIALAAGLYTQRVDVLEWYRGVTVPALPEAIPYEEVAEVVEEEGEEDVENFETVEEVAPGFPAHRSFSEGGSLGGAEADTQADTQDEAEVPLDVPPDEPVEESTIPPSKNLAVPFTSQAPNGNWDEPYQEACEEASVYMVHAYFSGMDEGQIPASTADEALLQIVAFEMELFGFYKDTTAEKTGVFTELLYGHTYELLHDPTVEEIQRKLVQGHPIVVPAAGRLLGNPYFTAPGPLYHMLVIRGYTEDGQFIVNDPGTYRGEAYLYDFDTIMNAMHDWNDGEEITEGKKVVLVLSP